MATPLRSTFLKRSLIETSPYDPNAALKEKAEERKKFEAELEKKINQGFKFKGSYGKGFIAVINIEERNSVKINVYSLEKREEPGRVVSVGSLKRKNRLLGKFIPSTEDGITIRTLKISKEPREQFTIYDSNERFERRIKFALPSRKKIMWMYGRVSVFI